MKKNIYKISGFIITLSVITALITPLFASAQTVDSTSSLSTQVQSLLNQISILESQLKSLVSSNMSSTSMMMRQDSNNPSMTNMMGTSTSMMSGMGAMRCLPIMRDLSQGSSGDDVSGLQQVLAADGFLSASSTTGYFGPLTAHAVMQFQSQFGIASSSTGVVGPLTRNFLRGGCSQGQNGGPSMGNGSSTSAMWQEGSSTAMMRTINPFNGGSQNINQVGNGTSTDRGMMHPMIPAGIPGMFVQMSATGSTTMPMPPCMQGGAGSSTTDSNVDNSAAVAAALFVPHTLIPGMPHPCPDVSGEMQQ